MKILHYSLGFPPYRTGGLTKFCIDVIQEQITKKNEVYLLWPGQIKQINGKVKIVERKKVGEIGSFEIINPLPISYDEGISNIECFTKMCDKKIFIDFLKELSPNVIHVHTLMGLHKEFFQSARELNIKLVFSTHDFFPICPKVTMFKNGDVCKKVSNCIECPRCNITALPIYKMFLLQHPIYRFLKDQYFIKKLRKNHRDHYLSNDKQDVNNSIFTRNTSIDYLKLRAYYEEIMQTFNVIHANSELTKNIYKYFFKLKNIKVINISHANIKDNRKKKKFLNDRLVLTYLGPQSAAKGYYLLKDTLDKIWSTNKKIRLNLYFTPSKIEDYMIIHHRYTYQELEKIFINTDVLIVPSIWYETFGFTVLEALSFGVPVIVSNHVGAQDIIPNECGIIINDITSDKLKETIELLSVEMLESMNNNIINKLELLTLSDMVKKIMDECYM